MTFLKPNCESNRDDSITLTKEDQVDINKHFAEILNAAGAENVSVNVRDLNVFVRSNNKTQKLGLLRHAIKNGHVCFVEKLLCYTNTTADRGYFLQEALYSAACHAQEELIVLILQIGAEINGFSTRGTALSAACESKNIKILNRLVCLGADVDLCRKDGAFLPLEIASNSERGTADPDIFNQLLAMNADISDPRIVCNVVRQSGEFEFILNRLTQMQSFGFDANASLENGDRPLGIAVNVGNQHNVRKLLSAGGADINASCFGGKTALGHAAILQDHKMMAVLMEYHPNVDALDDWDNTALFYSAPYLECTTILIKAGATVDELILKRANGPAHYNLKLLFEKQQQEVTLLRKKVCAKEISVFQRESDGLWVGQKLGSTISLAKTEKEALARALEY